MVVAITSLLDSSESRAKELNGLLETTLTKVSIDEAGDANICESKWVDKVKPDGSTKSRLVVQGFTQVWLKDYHDTFSAVASVLVQARESSEIRRRHGGVGVYHDHV